jgi:hypothetical protein
LEQSYRDAIYREGLTMQAAIGYIRVSTREQGRSGLGLAAQRQDIEVFGEREGFAVKTWYQDVQTGAGSDVQEANSIEVANRRKAIRTEFNITRFNITTFDLRYFPEHYLSASAVRRRQGLA